MVKEYHKQVCQLKFKLRELTSCLFSAPAWAVCFEGSVAGANATLTGNEVSQPTLEFTSLIIRDECCRPTCASHGREPTLSVLRGPQQQPRAQPPLRLSLKQLHCFDQNFEEIRGRRGLGTSRLHESH